MTATSRDSSWLGMAGKVCVVTGAASGIGAAVVEQLAAAGAAIALLDRDGGTVATAAEALRGRGLNAVGIECDVSSEAAIVAAAATVRESLGPCVALVNNAGVLRPASLDDVTLDEWNAVMGINMTGYLLCARNFARQMREAGKGSIVNVASIASFFPQTRSGAYSASKAAVVLLSRQMAVEWGPVIRSNSICPGMIKTALSAKFYAEPGLEEKRAKITASGRVGLPIDIANAAMFLLSDRSAYVNGTELLVAGGMDSMLMDLVPRPGFNSGAASQG